ncbi:plastocyanin/azurin family copper-binding protein [Halapricum hydrolyticum]|uniref:Plastocyanin/azurin family copper-binding protein n=1 Tax=Halapricum hydrolyticum TaxID=2979991 RepID=A0AAE3I8S8_9EURY|nr:plastocyanin/azurin family copper-binding protein [Halapricum hydrolyticum]MCU4716938.1 plastocyanin/azurin family copper-binding protein [Halapricum hydrolyticum]MCU4725457.1 plastocyanin/azurin family copper-binding protein [Halapricum hydrolyticum]
MPEKRTLLSRRAVLAATGGGVSVALAGCSTDDRSSQPDEDDTTVVVGPNGSLAFEPTDITVSVGETITWTFESDSHNVSAWPAMHDRISIPGDATGFGTMQQDGDPYETVPSGETFEHTFDEPGEYTYVCVPHAASMVGTVTVE